MGDIANWKFFDGTQEENSRRMSRVHDAWAPIHGGDSVSFSS